MTKPGSQRNPMIESLKDRIARDPLSRAFLQLAEEYRKEGRFQEAIDVCLDGLQRHPTYHTARISLGRTYMEGGDLENARRAFVEVLDLQPENHLAAKLLAEIQKKMGDPAGAAATYRSILSYYPNDREVVALLDETLRQGTVTAPQPSIPAPPPPQMSTHTPKTPPASPPAPSRVAGARRSDPQPDFRPEDFGGFATAPSREHSVPPPAWSGPASEPIGEFADDDAMQTNTLAELYLRQGLVDRAVEVYRGMLRVDPGNQKAARRLNDLVPTAAPTPAPTSPTAAASFPVPAIVHDPTPPSTRPAPAVLQAPTAPIGAFDPERDARRNTIRRLERWLASVSGAAAKGAPLR